MLNYNGLIVTYILTHPSFSTIHNMQLKSNNINYVIFLDLIIFLLLMWVIGESLVFLYQP